MSAFGVAGVVGGLAGSLLGNKLFGSSDSGPSLAETIQYQKELYDYKFKKELEAMNSAHQREVTDLRNAGLNPILSATGGSGLSSPTGSMPDISSVNSATVAAKQANRQMTMNALVSLGDLFIRDQQNRVANRQADASLQNAETNSLETASKIAQRNFQNKNLDMDTRKKYAEIGVLSTQGLLNSALASQANTNAWYQRSIFPSAEYHNKAVPLWNFGTAQAGDILEPYFQGLKSLHQRTSQNMSSAFDYVKNLGSRWWNAWSK